MLVNSQVLVALCKSNFRYVVNLMSLREVHVVFFTTCGNICGVFHHKSKSPQVLVVILFMVGSKVREHSTSGANMFDSMCT